MEVVFDKSFYKSLSKLNSEKTKRDLTELIFRVENAKTLSAIPNLKKIKGFKNYYRIRIGDFRIGMALEKNALRFIVVASRKEIYRIFP